MSSTHLPKENETSESEDLAGNKLKDLEQHISQRINRLGDAEVSALNLEEHGEGSSSSFIPPFEPMEPYSFPDMEGAQPDYRHAYESVRTSSQGINELLTSVHELSDILTESVLNLNIRLNSIEERIANGVDDEDRPSILTDLRTLMQQNQTLMKQNLAHLKKNAAGNVGKESGDQPVLIDPAGNADIIRELQSQVKALEDYITRAGTDVKQRVDDRHGLLREQLDIRAKVLEKLSGDNRDYLNRHFFSLAILFIIILFIAGALITNSVDRLSGYIAEQHDALRMQVDQLTQAVHNSKNSGSGP